MTFCGNNYLIDQALSYNLADHLCRHIFFYLQQINYLFHYMDTLPNVWVGDIVGMNASHGELFALARPCPLKR